MSSVESIRFVVTGYSWKKKAGKDPVFKVSLKAGDGHTLNLVSSSRDIFSGFPADSVVDVKIGKAQRTLDEVPEEA